MEESIIVTTESNYLLISNKKKVSILLSNSSLSQEDIMDTLISLHIILEVGINTLLRHLVPTQLKIKVGVQEITENLDKINFIDKVIFFIYYSEFKFPDLEIAANYHGIINKIRNFSEMRNKLLHGHSISTHFNGEVNKKSKLMEKLNLSKLGEQINDFKFILEGIGFYVDSLNTGLTKGGKESYKKAYLDTSFLPIIHFKSE